MIIQKNPFSRARKPHGRAGGADGAIPGGAVTITAGSSPLVIAVIEKHAEVLVRKLTLKSHLFRFGFQSARSLLLIPDGVTMGADEAGT